MHLLNSVLVSFFLVLFSSNLIAAGIEADGNLEILYSINAEQVPLLFPVGASRYEITRAYKQSEVIENKNTKNDSDFFSYSKSYIKDVKNGGITLNIYRNVYVVVYYDDNLKVKNVTFTRNQKLLSTGLDTNDKLVYINREPTDSELETYLGSFKEITPLKIQANISNNSSSNSKQSNNKQPIEPSGQGWKLGLRIAELEASSKVKGVQVESVTESGVGATAGLRAGDVITQVNQTNVTGVSEFISSLQNASPTMPLILRVISKGKKARSIKINPNSSEPIDV